MDWDIPPTIGRHTQLVRFHRGKRHYTSVGIIGMVGMLSAMYDNHWAATLNQAPICKLGVRYFQWPGLQRLRAVCDEFGTYHQFIERLEAYQTMTPFAVHVVGTKPKRHVVVNALGESFSKWRLEKDQPFLIQTNHFVDPDLAEYNDEIENWIDEDGTQWCLDSKPRYQALLRQLTRGLPGSLAEAHRLIKRNRTVTTQRTMQSMVLCPASGELLLDVRVD